MCKFFNSLEVVLCRVRDRGLISFCYIWISSFPRTICWSGYHFANVCFEYIHSVWNNHNCIGLSLSTYVFWCQYNAIFATIALLYILRSSNVVLPASLLLLRIALSILGPLFLPNEFHDCFFFSMKNIIRILIGITLKLYSAFGVWPF